MLTPEHRPFFCYSKKGLEDRKTDKYIFSENSNLSMGPFRIGLVLSSLLIVHTYNRTPIILNTNDIVWVGIGTVSDVATAIVLSGWE